MHIKVGSENGSFDTGSNTRVTPLGVVLRTTKLDELPQLFNVLAGHMSIVGPRPEIEKWSKVYSERWDKVLKIKPGITDNASIEFRREEELLAHSKHPEETYKNLILPQKLDYYEKYVDDHSLIGDLVIIIKTIHVCVFK